MQIYKNLYNNKAKIEILKPLARCILFSGILMPFSSNAKANDYENFVKQDCVVLFKEVGAGDKIMDLWKNQAKNMEKILASKMVQGMKNNTLTREKFDELYMKPDVIYIYNLGLALEKRAAKEPNESDRENIMMFVNTLLGFQSKFAQYQLSITDQLKDEKCTKHIDFVANKTTLNELYISIITDMMPYVCFANYLHNTITSDDNIWMKYAKNFVEKNGTYPSVSPKLTKYFKIANDVMDKKLISNAKAEELFAEGIGFEAYFIEEAMKSAMLKRIVKSKSNSATGMKL